LARRYGCSKSKFSPFPPSNRGVRRRPPDKGIPPNFSFPPPFSPRQIRHNAAMQKVRTTLATIFFPLATLRGTHSHSGLPPFPSSLSSLWRMGCLASENIRPTFPSFPPSMGNESDTHPRIPLKSPSPGLRAIPFSFFRRPPHHLGHHQRPAPPSFLWNVTEMTLFFSPFPSSLKGRLRRAAYHSFFLLSPSFSPRRSSWYASASRLPPLGTALALVAFPLSLCYPENETGDDSFFLLFTSG